MNFLLNRLILVAILLITAFLKVVGSRAGVQELEALHIGGTLRLVFTGIEVAIVILLLGPAWRWGGIAAFGFGAMATLYVSCTALLGLDVEVCGCFGARQVGLGGHLALTLGTMLVAFPILRAASRTSQPS